MRLLIAVYCDGCCEPNPGGVAAFGWAAYRGPEKIHEFASVACAGEGATNNVAEYAAVVSALGWLLASGFGGERVVVHSDSRLLVCQLAGRYRVKAAGLVAVHRRAAALAMRFREVSFRWIPREKNAEADALARKAWESGAPERGRAQRARELVPAVRRVKEGVYSVPSQSDPSRAYTVDLRRNTCGCPDFRARGKRLGYCKHILAARRFASLAERSG